MLTAKVAIKHGNGNLTIDIITVWPQLQDEVLVEIKAAGVCHTDYQDMSRGISCILGHEGAGAIFAAGAGVTHVQPGDYVLLNWATNCGECFQCQRGNYSICENRRWVPNERSLCQVKGIERAFYLGTMSTYTVVAKQVVNKINAPISCLSAAIVDCGVMTGYGSVVNVAKVEPGTNVVVIGAGGVGLKIVKGARIAGAERIIVIDINPTKLEMTKHFGATDLILANKADTGLLHAVEKVKGLTDGSGADYAFEATAVPALGAAPLAMIRNAGVAVQTSGVEEELTINMRLFEWDKVYINPRYGMCRPENDFPRLFQLYKKSDSLLDELITQTYRLEELPQAFNDMLTGINAKGVLVME